MVDQTQVQREPVARAIEILTWIAEHPETPWSVRQVARDMEVSPTTVHRIFGIFESKGLLAKDGSGGYLPAIGLYKLGRAITTQDVAVSVARRHIEALADACDETTMLGAYSAQRHQMMYVYVHQAHHPVQHIVKPNVWRPIYAGATGLAILAFLPKEERNAVYASGLESLTDRTVTDAAKLERELARIRKAGFVRTRGHHTVGAVAIAAPVFDAVGTVYGDVCVTIPDQRFDDALTLDLGVKVMETATAVTAGLNAAGFAQPALAD